MKKFIFIPFLLFSAFSVSTFANPSQSNPNDPCASFAGEWHGDFYHPGGFTKVKSTNEINGESYEIKVTIPYDKDQSITSILEGTCKNGNYGVGNLTLLWLVPNQTIKMSGSIGIQQQIYLQSPPPHHTYAFELEK